MTSNRFSLALLAAALIGAVTLASSVDAQNLKDRTYYFGTHPARTSITFVSEADLETIHGVTNAVTGQVRLDKTGTLAAGDLRVAVNTMKTGIALRDEHLRSPNWLDARKYPYVRLALVEAKVQPDGKTWKVKARITIKGVTKDVKTTARVRAFPDQVAKALGPGSWLRVRTSFPVTLSDFGIRIPQKVGSKVSATWQVGVDIYGTTAAPKKQR